MQKIFLFFTLFISLHLNAQFVRYRMDILSGKINGKEMKIMSSKIQADISDTNDVLKIGVNGDNERVGVKFYLLKITTHQGTYYLPSMKFYFIERSGFIKEVPFKLPDFEHPLTKSNKSYKITGASEQVTTGANHFEIKYNYYIDGNNLKYDEVTITSPKKSTSVLLLKKININDSLICSNKKLLLKTSPKLQSKEIARYLKKPVVLHYKVQQGNIGSLECIIIESALQFTNNNGEKDSIPFIQYMTLVKKNGVYEKLSCDKEGKNCKSLIRCDYDIIINKQE